jgi:hypothetical protein
LQALPTSKCLIVIASLNLHKGFCNEKDDPNLPDFNSEKKGASNEYVPECLYRSVCMYVFFWYNSTQLDFAREVAPYENLPFLPNPQVTTLQIGNVRDNMGALNLPCFFEGRVNLSIHTYNVNCLIFTIGFSR